MASNMTFNANLVPKTDAALELGSSSKKWKINGGGTTSQFLRGDGTWATPGGTYSLPLAASGTRGGIQIGYTTSGKKYAVQLDGEKAYVNVPWSDTTYTFDGTYDSSTNKAATVSTVTNAINALDVTNISGFGAGKTLKTLTESNGKIAATFQNISITKSQISDFPTDISAFTNDSGYLTSYTETDPTVPAWAKAESKPSYSLSEITNADDLKAIEALTGTSGLLKKTAANTWSLDTTAYLPKTGGQVTGALTMYASGTGDSPGIVFQRGTLTDSANDWKIYDKSGYLYFAQRGSGSTSFADQVYLDTSGTIHGKIDWTDVSNKPSSYYTLPTASSSTLGGIKIGFEPFDKNYPVYLDSDGRAYVNVPWINTDSWTPMTGATANSSGTIGYIGEIPPGDGYNTKYWRADGTWSVPPDTKYSSLTAASGGTNVSLVTTGEKYTWNNKLSSHQTIKQDGITGATINRFGVCSTAAGTAAKAVTITSGTFSLEAGTTIAVKFNNNNTASTPSLNVNSTGAKSIFVNGAKITTDASQYRLLKGTVIFVYDGTQYNLIGNYYNSNTWTAMTGATSTANGGIGYINAVPPKDGYNTKYWRADGTWAVPPATIVSITRDLTSGTKLGTITIDGVPTDLYCETNTNTSVSVTRSLTSGTKIGTITVNGTSTDLYCETNTNTDTLVKQSAKTNNTTYKLLMTSASSPTSGTAYEAAYDANITINPSTHTITATNFNGTATKATAANIATTQNSIAKYSNTTGTFANSGVTIDSNNNLIVPSTSYAQAGNITIGGATGSDQYTIKSNTTLQLDKNANTSIIFSDNGTEKIRIDTNNAFRPEVDSTLSIGTENYKWNNIYANTYNGAMANSITIGDKSYNGSEDVTLFASDLGVSSALNFAGVIYETLPNRDETGYPSTQNPVHLYIATGNHQGSTIGDGSAGSINPGTVVICHDTQDEFLWSEDSQGNQGWYSLGLASSFALHNHTHGNIENAGTMVATINGVSSANKAVITDANNAITIADLSTADPTVQNNATSTSFISSITQDSKGKITAIKSNTLDYVKKSGDTMSGNLTVCPTDGAYVSVKDSTKNVAVYLHASTSGFTGIYTDGYWNGSTKIADAQWLVYRDTNGNISLNGIANQAIQDGDGNTITSTYVKKAGDTMTGQLHINYNKDVGGTTAPGTTAPLVIGPKDGEHIEMDTNEILAKSNGTTPGTLWLQDGAGTVKTGGKDSSGIGLYVTQGHLQVSNGYLKSTANSNTVTIGSANSSYCHFENSANIPFYFNHEVQANGGFFVYNGNGQLARVGKGVSWYQGRTNALVRVNSAPSSSGWNPITSCKTTNGDWSTGTLGDTYYFVYTTDTNFNAGTNTTANGVRITTSSQLYGAVWNDYAEYRKDNIKEKDIQIPGKCVREVGDGTLALTTKRLERGCEIISDTFGFAIGQDEENGYNTPIASNGRVLAYPYESIEEFASHIGYPVCSGPDGTVSIMTDEEEEKYPSRIIGTISEIPSYEEWGTGKVKVNGRVWIRIR